MDQEKVLFISDGISLLGPYDKDDILRMFHSDALNVSSQIYDAKLNQWFVITEHPSFSEKDFNEDNLVVIGLHSSNNRKIKEPDPEKKKAKKKMPKPAAVKNAAPEPGKTHALGTIFFDTTKLSEVKEGEAEKWYVKDGNFRLGPYHYLTLLLMIRDNLITLSTFVRKESQPEWKPFDEYISHREMGEYLNLVPIRAPQDVPAAMSPRRVNRINLDQYLYVQTIAEPQVVWGFDISENGVAFVVEGDSFKVGQKATCTIISNQEEALEIHGKIIRHETVMARKANLTLNKYALYSDQEINLTPFEKEEE